MVQSGVAGGVSLTNDLGTGSAILSNNVNTGPSNASVAVSTGGITSINNGVMYANSNSASFGIQGSSGSNISISNGNNILFNDSANQIQVSLSRVGSNSFSALANGTISNVAGSSGLAGDVVNQATRDVILNADSGAGTGGLVKLGSQGSTTFSVGTAGMVGSNGAFISGVGAINMSNAGGFASGTITGLSNVPTAGYQPITFTGTNPGFPTPTVQISAGGSVTSTNQVAPSSLGGVGLGMNGIGQY